MMSLERVATNRRNAQRSTGPRTLNGKRISRQNALKHGVLARHVLLASERARDLTELDRRLRAALRPADEMESLLVDRVVSSAWRLRRVLQAESAELDRARAAVLYSKDDDPSAEFDENVAKMGLTMRELGEMVSWLQDGGDPCEDLSGGDVGEDDPLPDAFGLLGNRHFPEVVDDDNDDHPGLQVRRHVLALGWTAEGTREALLKVLTEEIHARRREIRERARHGKEAKRLALGTCLVPQVGSLDRLLRYEAAIERSFFRALHELHRLQAARAGVPVPPPAALDVDVGVTTEP